MLNENKEFNTFNMPWEDEYGYVQAVKNGNTVYLSGQLGHSEKGELADGMEQQMETTYQNIKKLLDGFGYTPDDIVSETIYVTDMRLGFQARKKLGVQFYPDPKRISSSIVGVTELAIPGQMVEIGVIAVK